MVSVIIPAYNEGPRLSAVVAAAGALPGPHEVIVVDDGSTDDTLRVARSLPVRAIHQPNGGKGSAMAAGMAAAQGDTVLFLDADLTGLRPEHVWRLAHPVTIGWSSMTIGQMQTPWPLSAYTSGQRATTAHIARVALNHGLGKAGYGVDAVLLQAARSAGGLIHMVRLDGVGHVHKAAKWGPDGIVRALTMPLEVLRHM